MFSIGDDVEVYSRSKERWVRGRVTNVVPEGQNSSAAGSVKVNLLKVANHDKWLEPSQFDQIRHSVPWETPVDPEAPPFSCLRALGNRYFSIEGSHKTGTEHQLRIGMTALEKLWESAVQEDDPKAQQEKYLIPQRVRASFADLQVHCSLGQDDAMGSVDLFEWLHHTLMRLHPPGPHAAQTIADELVVAGPKKLPQLVHRWMRMDKSGSGFMSKDDLADAFREEFWPRLTMRVADKMAAMMLRDLDAAGMGKASYSEFVLRCLGIDCAEVVLYYYDLSNDWAKYFSPLLLGGSEAGLWHTGLAAFGREYFYGGRICYGPPGATVWGRPTRAMRLGLTTKKLDNLREFVFMNLDRKYSRTSYDVLDRNCNHFSDEAAHFLLGRGIPDDVRLQPQRLMGAPVARMLRPLLNKWLGRVEQGKAPEEADKPGGRKDKVSMGGA